MDRKVLDYIDAHAGEYIELLRGMVRQPSQACTGEGISDMVSIVMDSLQGIGADPVLYSTKGNPIIYAFIRGKSDRVFGFYGHYDVQPVDPIELWDDDPYSGAIKDGAIYGRGVADNKNGLASKICAVDAWQKVYGRLPCSVKFIIEGEEEIGSPNLWSFAREHEDLLDCDGYNWESGWKEEGRPPQIHLGSKGLLYTEFRVRTALCDCHSCHAAIVRNPVWRLVEMFSSIKNSTNDRILIDGFYDGIPPLTDEEFASLAADTFDESMFTGHLGIKRFMLDLEGLALKEKYYFQPTANICGIISGYTGEGSKTVLPCTACAKMDFRLVPGQDPERIVELLRRHMRKHGFDEDIELIVHSSQPAFRSDLDSPFLKAVIDGLRELFDMDPEIHLMVAGTSPQATFCAKKSIPSVMFGCASETSNSHAPNEHMSVMSYIDEIKIIATVMNKLGT